MVILGMMMPFSIKRSSPTSAWPLLTTFTIISTAAAQGTHLSFVVVIIISTEARFCFVFVFIFLFFTYPDVPRQLHSLLRI
jgi:hypothetical protein